MIFPHLLQLRRIGRIYLAQRGIMLIRPATAIHGPGNITLLRGLTGNNKKQEKQTTG